MISFGKKIPVANCFIKDIRTNKPAKATVYEFDCKDYSDIEEMLKLDDSWHFKNPIAYKMHCAYKEMPYKKCISSFYKVEDEGGKTIGIAQTKDMKQDLVLDFLQTKGQNKYKYIGQSILSYLGKFALENGYRRIYVPNPVIEAYDFYTKKCKFRRIPHDCAVVLSKFGIKRLQHKLNRKIKSK